MLKKPGTTSRVPAPNKLAKKLGTSKNMDKPASRQAIVESIKQLGVSARAPHFAQFAEDVIREWGGSQEFAKALKNIYDATESVVLRQRILNTIMKMVERNTAMGGSENDLDAMSDTDLEAQAASILKKMYGDGRVFNSGGVANMGDKRRIGSREGGAAQNTGQVSGAQAGIPPPV